MFPSHDRGGGNNIDVSSGAFNVNADTQNFNSGAGTTQVITTNVDGNFGTELYYNNTKRFETKHGGAGVLGYFRVTGISTLGIVTGATYYGDGSNLTGIAVTANVSTNTLVVSQSRSSAQSKWSLHQSDQNHRHLLMLGLHHYHNKLHQ